MSSGGEQSNIHFEIDVLFLNFLGLSCSNCSQGYMRSIDRNTPYDSCVACDCFGRSATPTPMCDEMTGECRNCRNGTTGLHCESCSANVSASQECTLCTSGYWGLGKDGCQGEAVIHYFENYLMDH